MKVLFTIAGLHPESGGPSRSVPALCEALAKAGTDVEILSLDYGEKMNKPAASGSLPVTFVDCSSAIARRMQWSPRFKETLRVRCRTTGVQILHDTGLWLSTNHAAAVVSRELKLPRVVSPRGMLTKWALHYKGWKKRLAWGLYQQRDLQSARVVHATSPAEIAGYREAGLNQPIAVIPNGVELLEARKSEIGNRKSEMRTVLFLGRIHPVKGLIHLVEAWNMVRPKGWRVVMAGQDEGGHMSEVKAEIRRMKVENDFEFAGPVEGEAKWDLYRSADLFVLPSHSENFGLVVAEALACGVPVITSRGTPWEDLITHRCGWWVEIGAQPLAVALNEAINLPGAELQAMGLRGQRLVQEKYTWPAAARKMVAVYHWMLDSGPKPDCVI